MKRLPTSWLVALVALLCNIFAPLNATNPFPQCNSQASLSIIACDSFHWNLSGITYFQTGTDSAIIPNMAGCDSLVILDLTLQYPIHTYDTTSDCDQFWWNQNLYFQSGDYVYYDTSGPGCGTVEHLNLTIYQSFEDVEEVTSCFPFYWPVTGLTYSSSGWHIQNFINPVTGCDSAYVLDYTIHPINVNVINQSPTLISEEIWATYQWVNCGAGYQFIPNATAVYYTATVNGSYAVIVSKYGCQDTSLCHNILNVGEEHALASHSFSLFPTPSSESLRIFLPNCPSNPHLEVWNAEGKCILEIAHPAHELELDISGLPPGLYWLKYGSEAQKFIRQ